MNRFRDPPKSWREILEMIHETSLGKEVLSQFLPLYKRGKLQVRTYPEDLRTELLTVQLKGNPLGAAFVTDGEQGEIFYDAQGELGVVVPFVFHEMIHSLDHRLWLAAKESLNNEKRRQILFSSECRAFSMQHQFQEGLKKIYPDLRDFHSTRYPKLAFLNREVSEQEIWYLYCQAIK